MRLLIVLGTLAGLAGCATPQDDMATCAAYGFRPGTQEAADCAMRLGMERRANMQRAVGNMQTYRAPPPVTYRAPVQTTCTPIGNTVSCTSY